MLSSKPACSHLYLSLIHISEFELAAMEKRHIAKVLQHTKGNKAEASRLLLSLIHI